MRRLYPTLAIAASAAASLLLAACQQDDEPGNSGKEPPTFHELFGDVHPTHTWNMAKGASVWVKPPQDATNIKVYVTYGYTHWLVATSQLETYDYQQLQFDIPLDVTEFDVVVGGCRYTARNGQEIDASGKDGEPINITEYTYANPMRWVMAGEVTDSADYDFNDFVASITPNIDGSVTVQALAAGTETRLWLHYINEEEDYVLSPHAENGIYLESRGIAKNTATKYSWGGWFSDGSYIPDICVNSAQLEGVNKATGASITLPADLITTNRHFTLSEFCSSRITKRGKTEYARPTKGFYVTVGVHDTYYAADDYPIDKNLIVAWPEGYAPQLILIPDVSDSDTDFDHTGWQWPSEGSRISLTYRYFTRWIKDPKYNWSLMYPMGWPDTPAEVDKNGDFTKYGFYKR